MMDRRPGVGLVLVGVFSAVTGVIGIIAGSTLIAAMGAFVAALVLILTGFHVGNLSAAVRSLERRADAMSGGRPAAELDDALSALDDLAAADRPPAAAAPMPGAVSHTEMLLDSGTGLLNEEFFKVSLESRVSAARRHLRPIAVVLLELSSAPGDTKAESQVADGIRATLRDADTACRLDDGRFALILEDTPENGAVWTVERIRRNLTGSRSDYTMWAGVACYPAHAFDAWELLTRAGQALLAAKEWNQDRIEVATPD
jgi:diguanylate cyclase (GGDEF)-like protein